MIHASKCCNLRLILLHCGTPANGESLASRASRVGRIDINASTRWWVMVRGGEGGKLVGMQFGNKTFTGSGRRTMLPLEETS